jgi:hypothetical protein
VSIANRLRRLEQAHEEEVLRKEAERLAEQYGIATDEVLHRLYEITERIARDGLDAEIRRFAGEAGISEEEARAAFETKRREMEERR